MEFRRPASRGDIRRHPRARDEARCPGSISFNCATGRMIFAPFDGCCFISSNSSAVSAPGFFSTRSSTPIFPTSCSSAEIRILSSSSALQPKMLRDDHWNISRRGRNGLACRDPFRRWPRRAFGWSPGKARDSGPRPASELLDELFDVAGHVVECFGQLADFRGALHGGSLVKFTAADGAALMRPAPESAC